MRSSPRSDRQDLQRWFESYRRDHANDVLSIDCPISPNEDATALISELERTNRSPIVWCPNVIGLGVPLITNVFGSRERIARILDATPDESLHEAYQRQAARAMPTKRFEAGHPPVFDAVFADSDVSLQSFPMLTHFASDRGPYITNAVFVADDPESGVGNLSYHRSMVVARNVIATSLHSRGHLWRATRTAKARGTNLRVAIVIGAHPLFLLAASARVAPNVDERQIAGGLLGEPLLVAPTPNFGIEVPALAEFVLEGEINPDAHLEEGPFGEFSGYSSDRSTNTEVIVRTVLRRSSPVLLDIASGRAADHLNLGRVPREAEMAERLRQRFPDVRAIHYPSSGTHFHAYLSISPSMPGSARQAMLGLLGWDPYLKAVVAVDDDINITHDSEVLWAVATRFQADRDLFVIEGLPGSLLDPSAEASGSTSRMAIDATRGPGFKAEPAQVSTAAVARAKALIANRGLSGLSQHEERAD